MTTTVSITPSTYTWFCSKKETLRVKNFSKMEMKPISYFTLAKLLMRARKNNFEKYWKGRK